MIANIEDSHLHASCCRTDGAANTLMATPAITTMLNPTITETRYSAVRFFILRTSPASSPLIVETRLAEYSGSLCLSIRDLEFVKGPRDRCCLLQEIQWHMYA